MPRPRFQFRLATIFLVVTCSAICCAVARTDIGQAILAITTNPVVAVAAIVGLATMVYGARMVVEANRPTWPWPPLLVILGFLMIYGAICGGALYLMKGFLG